MVVQHNIPALNSHRNLGINNAATAKNLEKLSSGYKINRAGDDAAGLAISEKMRGQIRGLAMAEQNANNGISLIQTAEGGLNETHAILQRMRELAVQSANGTYQDSDRSLIELEYQALKSEIDRIASYTNYNGIKLLDGTVGGTMLTHANPVGDLQNTLAALGVTLDTNGANAVNFAGANVNGTTAAQTFNDAQGLGFVNNFTGPAAVTSVGGGTAADVVAAGSANISLTYNAGAWTVDGTPITGYTGALNGAGDLVFTHTDGQTITIGLGLGGFTATTGLANGATIDLGNVAWNSAAGSTGVGVVGSHANATFSGGVPATPYANAVADFTSDLSFKYSNGNWTITGALLATDGLGNSQAFELMNAVTIKAGDTGTKTLTFENEENEQITITINESDFAEVAVGGVTGNALLSGSFRGTMDETGAFTEAAGATVGYTRNASTPPLTPDQLRAARMLDAMGLSADSEFLLLIDDYLEKDAYIFTRQSTDEDERGNFAAPSTHETLLQIGDKTFLGELDQTTGTWSFIDNEDPYHPIVVATLDGGTFATETGSIRFNIGDSSKTGQTDLLINKENAIIGTENQAALVFQIGANGAEDQRVGLYVMNMASGNLGLHDKGQFVSASSILTRDEADKAIETLDGAINYVSAQRAQLGALQNRLEHTLNNLGVTKENLTAAESSIRDVDMAKEMMEFTKNNILVQASQAMLAQANQLPQGVLQLLR